jgi:L-threonylcarbamoyladenylate synthase
MQVNYNTVMMKILKLSETTTADAVKQACETLAAGGLLLFPTETTYGAGVDATNQVAVDTLLAYKSRREGKPLSIAVTDIEMAKKYVDVNESAEKLYERFLPGPVTVISKSKNTVAEGVASEYGTVGVRIPAYDLVLDILKAYGKPMTATSANGSGEKRPYTIQDVFDGLSEKQKSLVSLVIDAGELPQNPPSTVIDTTLGTPVIFRQGEKQIENTKDAWNVTSHSEKDTMEVAQRVMLKHWEALKARGLVIVLHGSLGVGKTIFAKGVGQFLNISETMTSPTYVLMLEYPYERYKIQGTLYHLDLWRLEKPEVIDQLNLEELIQPGNVMVVEWASLAEKPFTNLIKKSGAQLVEITFTEEGTDRHLSIREAAE